jgi:hypothetical protein
MSYDRHGNKTARPGSSFDTPVTGIGPDKCKREGSGIAMNHYRINLDASHDLWSAGFVNDAEQIEAFVESYRIEAEIVAHERDITLDIVVASHGSPEAHTCDTTEDAAELWQLIHDRVSWDGPRR